MSSHWRNAVDYGSCNFRHSPRVGLGVGLAWGGCGDCIKCIRIQNKYHYSIKYNTNWVFAANNVYCIVMAVTVNHVRTHQTLLQRLHS